MRIIRTIRGRYAPPAGKARKACLLLMLVFITSGSAAENASFSSDDLEFFEKEVRPVLVARCYECHSGQVKEPKGGFRVDSREALLTGGDTGPAIVVGQPNKSLLIDAINYGELYQMPPKTRLPESEVAVLSKWIARGAPWPNEVSTNAAKSESFDLDERRANHWCWQPVKPHPLPAVLNTTWPKQDLDQFILARLEDTGLTPAAPADKRTLIRRVYFDLIGLPPLPEDVERFVQDESPQAFERVVDGLLESPHFGERWARHWMDLVRYAETCGHEFDYPIPHAWRYRDYLIRAFNNDVPYDQFVLEHLAGDLLPRARMHPREGFNESILATAFWFLHEATHAPVDVRSDYAVRIDNQIDVMSKTFLGLTVSCARCHDHKFDAISTKDYYGLAGVLQSSRRQEAMLDPRHKIHDVALRVADEREKADARLADILKMAESLSAEQFARYLIATREVMHGNPKGDEKPDQPAHRRSLAIVAEEFELGEKQLLAWVDALADPSLDEPLHPLNLWKKLALHVPLTDINTIHGWREETRTAVEQASELADKYDCFAHFNDGSYEGWFPAGEAFGGSPTKSGQWDFQAKSLQILQPGIAHGGRLGPRFQGVLRSPTFTINHRNVFYRIAGSGCEVRLIVDGYTMIEFHQLLFKELKFDLDTKDQYVWHRQSGDLGMYLGHRAYLEIIDQGNGWTGIDEIWFSDRETPPPQVSSTAAKLSANKQCDSIEQIAVELGRRWREALRRFPDTLTAEDTQLLNWLLRHPSTFHPSLTVDDMAKTHSEARERIDAVTADMPSPFRFTAITDGTGEDQQVFIRGNPRTLGERAPRQLPSALVGDQPAVERGSGRFVIAQQIADPANPLTARVLVNRLWHHLFGRGIVASVDNFGALGEQPSHPELLDHLAQQFVQEGWSIKRLLRTLVLSSTYQASSSTDPRATEQDPTNQLWHSMPIRRLQAEAVRDAVLTISGQLDRQQFGPSVAVHITPFMQGRGRPATSGPVDGDRRRSVYLEVRRNFLSPIMLAFDSPIPFSTVGRRNLSNVPAQALILMNDPFFVGQAKHWSAKLLADPNKSFDERVEQAYLAAFARSPTPDESDQARRFFEIQGKAMGIPARQSHIDPRIWSDYCHVLFNVKEFVFIR